MRPGAVKPDKPGQFMSMSCDYVIFPDSLLVFYQAMLGRGRYGVVAMCHLREQLLSHCSAAISKKPTQIGHEIKATKRKPGQAAKHMHARSIG